MDFTRITENLKTRGYTVKSFATGKEAVQYLNETINGVSVGIGGSATVRDIGLFELLETHNIVYWHWQQEPDKARQGAMNTEVYIASVNGIAETGEIVNIDGNGNRLASMMFGHKKLYLVVGKNKITKTYEDAVWRARNIAAPQRAQQLKVKTPCAIKGDRCYDCKSPERICRGMVTMWGPTSSMACEVIFIDEELGL